MDHTDNRGQQSGRAPWRELTDGDFEHATRGGVVVALLYSPARGHDPARLLGPAAGLPYDDDVRFAALDADANPDTAARFGNPGLPALVCLRNGVVKNVQANLHGPDQAAQAARDNACYRCPITRSRTEQRKTRRFRRTK